MRILIATAFFPPEPIVEAQMAFDIASKLSTNHDVTVLKPKPSRPVGYFFHDDMEKYPFWVTELNTFIYTKPRALGRSIESFD